MPGGDKTSDGKQPGDGLGGSFWGGGTLAQMWVKGGGSRGDIWKEHPAGSLEVGACLGVSVWGASIRASQVTLVVKDLPTKI